MFKVQGPVSTGLISVVLGSALIGCGGGSGGEAAQTASGASSAPETSSSRTSGDASVSTSSGLLASTITDSTPTTADRTTGNTVEDAGVTVSDKATIEAAATTSTGTYLVQAGELIKNNLFTQALTSWTINRVALGNSEVRTGGKSITVAATAVQSLATTVLPHHSYTLTVTARNTNATGYGQLLVTFRTPTNNAPFRVFATPTITSATYQTYTVDFTAPEYVGTSDFSVVATGGARLIVDSTSLQMRSLIPTTEPITSPLNTYAPAGYNLAFNDEFNGTTLNRNKWFTRYIYAGGTLDYLNDEKQRYRDNDNQQVANGVLSLVARKVRDNDPNGVNYESGMIRSDWTTRYGYLEARVKMPGGLGVWPAFWLNSDVSSTGRLEWPPEVDIFEFVNNGVEDKVNMLHSGVITPTGSSYPLTYSAPTFNTTYSEYIAPFNFNQDWHTIGCLWDETSVTTYVDGVKMFTRAYTWNYKDGTLGGPAHILLDMAIGGSWAGRHGIDDSMFPQALQIDWVRAYQKAS